MLLPRRGWEKTNLSLVKLVMPRNGKGGRSISTSLSVRSVEKL
jgi:hypothetical protein